MPSRSGWGGTQALRRSETVPVLVDGRAGFTRRPKLVGALVVKAAAHGNSGDADPRRHRRDFVVLAGLLTAADFAAEEVSKTDRRRLRAVVNAIRADRELVLVVPDATTAIDRLVIAAKIVD